MAKSKSVFFCQECGYESPGWLGKCPGCGAWNSFVEEKRVSPSASKTVAKAGVQTGWLNEALHASDPRNQTAVEALLDFDSVTTETSKRYDSGIPELDRVLGGGVVPGSLVLFGGDPGIGKSTLLLQLCQSITCPTPLLYVCGEESAEQIKLRGERLGLTRKGLKLLPETRFEAIANVLIKLKPKLCIIDSIQTVYSEELSAAPGSVSQVRDCTAGFLRLAKHLGTTILLIGHVTKEGTLAGPRILEHMVDTVLTFEGESQTQLRIIRASKNRFGTTNEIGVFEMTASGLQPMENPSETLLSGRPTRTAGAALTATMEGTRPLLLEIQALLVPSSFASPIRMTQGLDRGRAGLLLAVAEKFLHAGLDHQDAYINVVGGFRIQDPASDLAVLAAMLSCHRETPLPHQTLLLGEVGLTGELRPVSQVEARIREAIRLGFHQVILPGANRKMIQTFNLSQEVHTDLICVDNLNQAIDILFIQGESQHGKS